MGVLAVALACGVEVGLHAVRRATEDFDVDLVVLLVVRRADVGEERRHEA